MSINLRIPVSRIRSIGLRRAAIVAVFPFVIVICLGLAGLSLLLSPLEVLIDLSTNLIDAFKSSAKAWCA